MIGLKSNSKHLPMSRSYVLIIAISLLLISNTRAGLPQKPNGSINPFARQFLGPQNVARASLRLPPLVWDAKLEHYARWYSNQRRNDCALVHSNGPYGENIFWGSGDGWTPAQAVAAWVSERQWYNYLSNSCAGDEECGHYTQVVWKNTRRVGCARVTCVDGKGVFMTCNYDPPGNFIGERPY